MEMVKSKQRVADHGEVFTPPWMVEAMLDLVKDESGRIDARFLEPACGSGNFLVPVLMRKLTAVQARYGKSDFERRHHALLGLMCIYGIELLEDNVAECRGRTDRRGDRSTGRARRVLDEISMGIAPPGVDDCGLAGRFLVRVTGDLGDVSRPALARRHRQGPPAPSEPPA